MSNLIFEGAEFGSFAAFKAVLNTYCVQNAVNGVPLKFARQSSAKLKPNTFKNETLDQATIDQFIYQKQALVCVHRTKEGRRNGDDINCGGRITFRFDKEKKRILVSSYFGDHTNHPNQSNAHLLRNISPRERQLQSIFGTINKLPDGALNLVQETVEVVLREWSKDNIGLNIIIESIDNDQIEPNQVEAQPLQADLQQYLLNRLIEENEHELKLEISEDEDVILSVCSSDEDDADADADDDMDPRHFVQAQLTKPEIAIIDLTEDSQMAVAEPELELQQEPTQFRDKANSIDSVGTIKPIVSFSVANDKRIEEEINNNTPIDLSISSTDQQTKDLIEQTAHDLITVDEIDNGINAHTSTLNENSVQNESQKQSTQLDFPVLAQPLNAHTFTSWLSLANNPFHRQNDQEASMHSDHPNDENNTANDQGAQNDNVFNDDFNTSLDDDNSEMSTKDDANTPSDLDQPDEPKQSDNNDDIPMITGTTGTTGIMQPEDSIPLDELMSNQKIYMKKLFGLIPNVEQDELLDSQVPAKRSKLSECINLIDDDDDEPSEVQANVKSAKDEKSKRKFRKLKLSTKRTTIASPITWNNEPPKVLKNSSAVKMPDKEPVVQKEKPSPKPKMKEKSNTRQKNYSRSKLDESWLDYLSDMNAFED